VDVTTDEVARLTSRGPSTTGRGGSRRGGPDRAQCEHHPPVAERRAVVPQSRPAEHRAVRAWWAW